jgi:hypothetical protein
VKFTKRQQKIIDSCIDSRVKQTWIEHFTHIQELKQSPQFKEFKKEEREKEKRWL